MVAVEGIVIVTLYAPADPVVCLFITPSGPLILKTTLLILPIAAPVGTFSDAWTIKVIDAPGRMSPVIGLPFEVTVTLPIVGVDSAPTVPVTGAEVAKTELLVTPEAK